MIPASVGYQCPQCVEAFARKTRQNEGPFGGAVSRDPRLTTHVLIGVNLVGFALLFLTGGGRSSWVNWLGLSPAQSFHVTGQGLQVVPGVAHGAVWQMLTSLFVHYQVLHVGMNMLTLWFLGPPLERIFGRARFLALYLLSGLAGSVVVLWLSSPNSVTVGASGSLFGLIAGLIVVLHRLRQDFRQILLWLAVNVLFTLTVLFGGNISWQGHLGGLLGGAAIAAILVHLPAKGRSRNQWLALAGVTVGLIALAAARVAML